MTEARSFVLYATFLIYSKVKKRIINILLNIRISNNMGYVINIHYKEKGL